MYANAEYRPSIFTFKFDEFGVVARVQDYKVRFSHSTKNCVHEPMFVLGLGVFYV
jgi:hypothetical protein